MTFYSRRRIRHLLLLAVATIALLVAYRIGNAAFLPVSMLTGWALCGAVVVLAAYNVRKKFPFLPLIASTKWLQLHIYLGLLSGVLFLCHIGGRIPTGRFEWLLAILFVGVFCSGLIGLYLTRSLPEQLNRRGENIIYERLPRIRRALRDRAEAVVLASTDESETTVLADLYHSQLHSFFAAPRHALLHMIGSSRPAHGELMQLDALTRYLKESDCARVREMRDLVRLKNDADYRHAAYAALKYWLFVHIPLTWGLLLTIVPHIVLVYAFSEASR